jgi:hypothetical protein
VEHGIARVSAHRYLSRRVAVGPHGRADPVSGRQGRGKRAPERPNDPAEPCPTVTEQ